MKTPIIINGNTVTIKQNTGIILTDSKGVSSELILELAKFDCNKEASFRINYENNKIISVSNIKTI